MITHNPQACKLNIDLNGLGSRGVATVGPSHLQTSTVKNMSHSVYLPNTS